MGERGEREIQSPSVSLKNYGGQDISLVGEVDTMLARGNRKVTANLQLQPDAGGVTY